MTSTTTHCAACRRPNEHAGLLCRPCVKILEQELAAMPLALRELEITASRQDRIEHAFIATNANPPPPLDPEPAVASKRPGQWLPSRPATPMPHLVANQLPPDVDAFALARKARGIMAEWWGQITPDGELTAPDWLIIDVGVEQLRRLAAKFKRDLHRTYRDIENIVFKPAAEQLFAGTCTAPDVEVWLDDVDVVRIEESICGADLFCQLTDTDAECVDCGATYNASERWDIMRATIEQIEARPRIIAAALRAHGYAITEGQLDNWIYLDKQTLDSATADGKTFRFRHPPILAAGADSAGKPVYRVGDVIDRVKSMTESRGRKTA